MPVHSLQNSFLIAMPTLHDTVFSRAVIYLCTHTEHGALGVVVNHPTEHALSDLLDTSGISATQDSLLSPTIFSGGPIEKQRGLVLHSTESEWEATLNVDTSLRITTSRDILQALAQGEGPKHHLIALGYAGWQAGQLEKEIRDNIWLTCPLDSRILFETPPEQRWQAAGALLDIDIRMLSNQAGHA
ncbi:MAG: YqgE/AlgH family protein [Pseudomonadota bacterium]